MAHVFYPVFLVISHLLLLSLSAEESTFDPTCPSFTCGKLNDINFPFSNLTHPDCGFLIVDGCNEPIQKVRLGKDGPWYNITSISYDDTITLEDQLFQNHLDSRSCESFNNLTLASFPLIPFEVLSNLTMFKCPKSTLENIPTNFSLSCNDSVIYYSHPNENLPAFPSQCSVIQLPVDNTRNTSDLFNLLTGEFSFKMDIDWRKLRGCFDCRRRSGECLVDSKGNLRCSNGRTVAGDGKLKLKLGLALDASGSGICILIILAFCFRKQLSSENTIIFWKRTTDAYRNIESFLRNYGSLAPKRYIYSDIKRITSSFKHKLGQGGYGVVYKGRLLDGRKVAVKVLNESRGNGEEFINEVASISKTSHVNIVSLLGYCFEGRRRALIYEFVPNGSLEKFIYEKDSLETNHKLSWETLYQIAVGIARGLEYLHRGCSTRILHFDIKPHNILLDEDFCPKISDFGLAKICPGKESIVSMTGARGTVGYIAPEVFCRSFGEVSHKSDVYSYGMMVFEMTGRKNNDVRVRANHSSDVYFPDWICKSLETDEEFVLQGIKNKEDKEYARKIIIISLWCIQTIPSNRPTISRVVEILEGSRDSLQIPPKPLSSSPSPGCLADSSTTQSTLTL